MVRLAFSQPSPTATNRPASFLSGIKLIFLFARKGFSLDSPETGSQRVAEEEKGMNSTIRRLFNAFYQVLCVIGVLCYA